MQLLNIIKNMKVMKMENEIKVSTFINPELFKLLIKEADRRKLTIEDLQRVIYKEYFIRKEQFYSNQVVDFSMPIL